MRPGQIRTPPFFRQLSNSLLARYFEARGMFGDLDFAAMRETQPDQLFAPWLDLPDRQRNEMDAAFGDIFELSCEKGFRAIIDEAEWFGPTSVFTSSQAHTTVRILADMQTFTLEEAAAVIANRYGWHEDQQKTLLKQLLDAAKDGTLIVRHPHTDLPYRPKEHCEYYERVGVVNLNRHFGEAGVPWQLDNDGETADPIFETEWWNLSQVLAWMYLGDRALVKQGALVNQGAAFDIQLMLAASDRQNACYPSFRVAQEALLEALRTGKLTAYGLRNGEGDLIEIPLVQWADLKIYWGCDSADHAGPSDCFRPMASRWFTLRFKRKAILEIWPDPLESPAMADDLDPAATTAEENANGEPRTRDNREDLFRSRPPAPAESERDKNALASDLASGIFAGIANKRWGEAQQKREPVLVKAESVARERWMHSDDDHAKMTRWLQNEYSPDENTLPFMDDKLTKHLRERMAKVAREIGKPVRGEKQSHG